MKKISNVRLVVADIDNTLVKKRNPLTPLAKKAIDGLKEKGIYFALASGRGIPQLHDLENQWQIKCELLIGMNGSEIYDGLNDTTEKLYFLKASQVKEAFSIMKPFKYNAHVHRNGISYISRFDEDTMGSAKYVKNQNMRVVEDESEFWEGDTVKIGFRVPAEEMPFIEKAVADYNPQGFMGIKTEYTMYEFCNDKATKGSILSEFCKRHNIDLKNVIAIGDMTNDNSMIEAAGIGVCMLNGSDDTKALAQIITDKTCDEDGFAHFIFDYVL